MTNLDNAFVLGSKVKYGHNTLRLPELIHQRDFLWLSKRAYLYGWGNGTDQVHETHTRLIWTERPSSGPGR